MAYPVLPRIFDVNGQAVYHSLDAVDQGVFDTLTTKTDRNRFLEMITHWLNAAVRQAEAPPGNGRAIAKRWNTRGYRIKKPSRLNAALRAVSSGAPRAVVIIPSAAPVGVYAGLTPIPAPPQAPAGAVTSTVGPAVSPLQSPLAELSPRFANNNDPQTGTPLSPTHGQLRFIEDQFNAPWRFASVPFQDEPAYKSVYRFVRLNADRVIEEQLAVKCLEVSHLEEDQVKREIQINDLIATTRCSHMLQCKGHGSRYLSRRAGMQHTVFLYQEFADYGDLAKLIEDHKEKNRQINEHFIWYTLRELTEALSALHDGRCPIPCEQQDAMPSSGDDEKLPSDPWMPILHLDIKSENVMLLKSNQDYPSYPKPVLGDFDLSCVNNDQLKNQLTDVKGPRFVGTPGWHPPERSSEALMGDGDNTQINPAYAPHQWPVTEKTDIWGLGLIAHQMIFAHKPDLQVSTLGMESKWPDLQADTQESHFQAKIERTTDYCSPELYRIVEQMLKHNPALRPNLSELRNTIYVELRRHDLVNGTEVRNKRKRDIVEHLQVYPSAIPDVAAKFDLGQVYSPTRKRSKIDLTGTARAQYDQLVNTWNSSNLNPDPAAQDEIVDAIDEYLVQPEDLENAEDCAAKHLVSCLRKRLDQDAGKCYVLKGDDIEEGPIDEAMSAAAKLRILDNINADFWEWAGPNISQRARDTFQHAVDWGRWLLGNCSLNGKPAEPRSPALANKSTLHQDATDEAIYNTLTRPADRNVFLQMIRDWKTEILELCITPPANGGEIQTR
ncbi:kinase-like protein [Macroventuria anomochaeta]|uniref:Kinase-like protein n=1 Tax=Macroventuria anomochaeta TaxID=301207 RepID=A0ACB6SBT7_9PLEO|nr:kinase-like protein [Macroventuria anomochaeta]KAF2631438.1 kinase-like protein [Macroventuria anomochaeta]